MDPKVKAKRGETLAKKEDISPAELDLLTCTTEGITSKLELLQTLDEEIISKVQHEKEIETAVIEADDYATNIKEQLTTYKSALRRATEPEVTPNASFSFSTSTETPSTCLKKVNLPKLTLTETSYNGRVSSTVSTQQWAVTLHWITSRSSST